MFAFLAGSTGRIGSLLFCIGLGKKVLLADTLAGYVSSVFSSAAHFIDSWVAVIFLLWGLLHGAGQAVEKIGARCLWASLA